MFFLKVDFLIKINNMGQREYWICIKTSLKFWKFNLDVVFPLVLIPQWIFSLEEVQRDSQWVHHSLHWEDASVAPSWSRQYIPSQLLNLIFLRLMLLILILFHVSKKYHGWDFLHSFIPYLSSSYSPLLINK